MDAYASMIDAVSLGLTVLSRASLFGVLAACTLTTGAFAADMGAPVPAPPAARLLDPAPLGYEVRLGGFAHAVASIEKGTAAVSLDLLFPRWIPPQNAWWDFFIPRAYVGGMINTAGRTSSLRGGALWTFPIYGPVFAEAFFGGAVHDGSINGEPHHNALGSRFLFHVGGSVGYRIDPRWSVLATFDHMSNGNRVFNTGFVKNNGINSYGVKVGYAF
jgi:lipid A 3-O-deacylase